MPVEPEPPDFSTSSLAGEAVVAGAVAAHAAESSGHGKPVHTHCENCGTALQGPFCHHCGQHDIDFHRSFGHMFLDALENFFHFDAKLFRNIVALLFRPGHLTADFNAGKRASQMPPLRLYIFISVLFFFLSFFDRTDQAWFVGDPAYVRKQVTTGGAAGAMEGLAEQTSDPAAKKKLTEAAGKIKARDEAQKAATPAKEKKPLVHTSNASGMNISVDEKDDTEFNRYLSEKGKYAVTHQREMAETFLHALPKMLLFCLPFFALFTRFLFRKSGQAYLQHLVVSLHFHTFIFLWRMFGNGWIFLVHFLSPGLAGLLAFGVNLWLVLYPFLMLRHLFRNSWPLTIFKTLVLAGAYTLTIGLGFVATAIVIFLML